MQIFVNIWVGQITCRQRHDGDYARSDRPCDSDYITCGAGIAYTRSCPSGLYFDETSAGCLEKQFVKDCGGQATTTARTTTRSADEEG